MKMLNIALPKGRLGEKAYGIFEKIGFTFHRSAETRTVDAYTITRKAKKARG